MIAFASQIRPELQRLYKAVDEACDKMWASFPGEIPIPPKPFTMADFNKAVKEMYDWPVCPCGFSIEPGTKCPCCGGTG